PASASRGFLPRRRLRLRRRPAGSSLDPAVAAPRSSSTAPPLRVGEPASVPVSAAFDSSVSLTATALHPLPSAIRASGEAARAPGSMAHAPCAVKGPHGRGERDREGVLYCRLPAKHRV